MVAAAHEKALPLVGVPLGFLIGALSGALTLLFLRTLQDVRKQQRRVLDLTGQLAGIPSLWLSVPFGSKLLANVRPERVLTSYILTLAVIWGLMVSWPLVKLVIATGNEIGSRD
jgi:hypothetical protein